jgi:hypothetical protein
MEVVSILAYNDTATIETVKSFIVQAHGANPINTFWRSFVSTLKPF